MRDFGYKLFVFFCSVLTLFILVPCFSHAQMVLNPSNISFDENILLTNNSKLYFTDGSYIDSLFSFIGPQGPAGSPGLAGSKGDKGDSFVLQIESFNYPINISHVWQQSTQASWQPVSDNVQFYTSGPGAFVKITWSDNVGIYGASWCNVGLFVDDDLVNPPVCSGAWSGVANTTIFNQQSMVCIVPPLSEGIHTIRPYHRSQYCYYGNSAFDSLGVTRQMVIEVLQ